MTSPGVSVGSSGASSDEVAVGHVPASAASAAFRAALALDARDSTGEPLLPEVAEYVEAVIKAIVQHHQPSRSQLREVALPILCGSWEEARAEKVFATFWEATKRAAMRALANGPSEEEKLTAEKLTSAVARALEAIADATGRELVAEENRSKRRKEKQKRRAKKRNRQANRPDHACNASGAGLSLVADAAECASPRSSSSADDGSIGNVIWKMEVEQEEGDRTLIIAGVEKEEDEAEAEEVDEEDDALTEFIVKSYSGGAETIYAVLQTSKGQIDQMRIVGHTEAPSHSVASRSVHENTLSCSSLEFNGDDDGLEKLASIDKSFNTEGAQTVAFPESNKQEREEDKVGEEEKQEVEEEGEEEHNEEDEEKKDEQEEDVEANEADDALAMLGIRPQRCRGTPTGNRSSSDSGDYRVDFGTSGASIHNTEDDLIERLRRTLGGGLGLHDQGPPPGLGPQTPQLARPLLPPRPPWQCQLPHGDIAPPRLLPVAGASSCPQSPLMGVGQQHLQMSSASRVRSEGAGDASLFSPQTSLDSCRSVRSGTMVEMSTTLWPHTPNSTSPHSNFMLPPPSVPAGDSQVPCAAPTTTPQVASAAAGITKIVYIPVRLPCGPHLCRHCGRKCMSCHRASTSAAVGGPIASVASPLAPPVMVPVSPGQSATGTEVWPFVVAPSASSVQF